VRRSRLIMPIEQRRRHVEVAGDLAFPLDHAKRLNDLVRRQAGRLADSISRHVVIERVQTQISLLE
jgi:hypothetical protein